MAHGLFFSCIAQNAMQSLQLWHKLLPCSMWDLSSPTKDRTCVPCIGRQIFNHWTTREVSIINAYGYSQVSASFFFKESGSNYFQLHGPYDLYPKYSVSATAAAKVAIDNMQMMRLHSNKTLLTQTGSMPPPGLSHGCTHLINIF